MRDAFPLALPAVLGIELAGVVTQTGASVSRFKVGDRVMGPLGGLGADVVIDRSSERFEYRAKDIDRVLDLVGGETLDRCWQVLASGGAIVSLAAPGKTLLDLTR